MWHAFLRGLLELCLYLAQVCVLCNLGGGGNQGVMTGDSMLYFECESPEHLLSLFLFTWTDYESDACIIIFDST